MLNTPFPPWPNFTVEEADAVRAVLLQQDYLEPVGAVLESERSVAIRQGLELARFKMLKGRRQVVVAGQVMVVARM